MTQHEDDMRLTIDSRTGNFNLMDPSEESVSCHIAILENGEKKRYINIRIDEEENPELPDTELAVELIEESMKRLLIDTKHNEKKEFIAFLRENETRIDRGTRKARIELLKKQIIRNAKEIKHLQSL